MRQISVQHRFLWKGYCIARREMESEGKEREKPLSLASPLSAPYPQILSVFPAHFSLRRHHYLNAWKCFCSDSIHTNPYFYPFVHDMLSGGLSDPLRPAMTGRGISTTVLHLFIGVHNSNRGGCFQEGGPTEIRRHIFQVSSYQMCVLMLFNRQERWTYEVFMDRIAIVFPNPNS